MSSRPPLDLTVTMAAADGSSSRSYTGAAASPLDRPTGIQFKTARFHGFTDGGFVLSRRSDIDHPDLRLLNEYVITGQDGSIAYEGRARDLPRDLSDAGHQVTVALAGWIGHMRDRRFAMIFRDGSLARWGNVGAGRTKALADASRTFFAATTLQDATADGWAVETKLTQEWTANSTSEAMYDAQGILIAKVYYEFVTSSVVNPADANWFWQVAVGANDDLTTANGSGDLSSGSTGSGTFTASPAQPYAFVQQLYGAAASASPGAEYPIYWKVLAVYGDHGLTLRGTEPAAGFYASDIVEWVIDNYCPKLNTAGVQATSVVLTNVAFHDRVFPYDVFGVVNRPHLNSFGVWDNKTVHFAPPPDMSDFDWQVRADDPGVRLRIQGDSTEHLVSGLEVEFTNVTTGTKQVLLPADYSELRDDSVENPYVRAGYPGEDTISISDACTEDEALEVGRVALAQRNQPRGVGEIDCSHHIRDRAGNWQPVWKVRADHRIAVVSSDNERPRLIGETSYNHDDRSLTIAVDSTLRTPDAILDTLR